MSKVHIYLAGPIFGCDKGEAVDWRSVVNKKLHEHMIAGVNPLRCEPLMDGQERYGTGTPDPRFGTWEAISAKNLLDVTRCDLTLAYFPYDLTERDGPSLGTVCELAWAKALGKPTIRVSTHPRVVKHPVITACSQWKLDTLDEALDTIIAILGVYT